MDKILQDKNEMMIETMNELKKDFNDIKKNVFVDFMIDKLNDFRKEMKNFKEEIEDKIKEFQKKCDDNVHRQSSSSSWKIEWKFV